MNEGGYDKDTRGRAPCGLGQRRDTWELEIRGTKSGVEVRGDSACPGLH